MKNKFPSKNWSAWHDFMPGSEPTLHITGEVTCPTSGYCAKLVPRTPQGINPSIYLLDLVVTPPPADAPVNEVVTDIGVHYQEDTRNRYQQVTIFPEEITVDVQIVS